MRPTSTAPRTRLTGDPVIAVALAVALTAFFLLPAQTFLTGYDWLAMQRFWKIYFHDAVLAGRLPLWNPHVSLGRPFLADIETPTLYPPNLVYLIGADAGFVCSIALHLGWVLLGGVRLLRTLGCARWAAWFGSIAFALSAPLMARLQSGQAQVFCTLCWLPWIFLGAHRVIETPTARSAAGFALVLALAFIAGSPPFFWVMAVGLAVFALLQVIARSTEAGTVSRLKWIGGAGLLAGGLVAVQTLPFLELVSQGNRSLGETGFSSLFPMTGRSWLSLFFAELPTSQFYWEYNLYAGGLVVLGAFAGFRWWRQRELALWVVVGGVGTLLALGPATPFFRWAQHLPGMTAWRYPSRYAILTDFALTVLAALVFTRLSGIWLTRRNSLARPIAAIAAGLLVIETADTLHAFWVRAPLASGGARVTLDTQIAATLRDAHVFDPAGTPPRIAYPPEIVRENAGMVHGFSTIAGVANPWLGRVWDYLCVTTGAKPWAFDFTHTPADAFSALEKFTALNVVAR